MTISSKKLITPLSDSKAVLVHRGKGSSSETCSWPWGHRLARLTLSRVSPPAAWDPGLDAP